MKPILFNTEMVRDILDGRKTVTRRAVKPQPFAVKQDENAPYWCGHFVSENGKAQVDKPPYRHGDILYVREAWNYGYCDTTDFEFQYNETFFEELKPGSMRDSFLFPRYFYRTEDLDGIAGMKWRPSIHMPREAARIFLRVTDVRVERLQDITDDGIARDFNFCAEALEIMNAQQKDVACMALWDSTINPTDRARYGWEANPWVWVIEFERCEKPKEAK